MSALSFLTGSPVADGWPMARVMAGLSAMPVGHAIDLAFFFPDTDRARHDALISETRRHLGGCLNAIETGLRLSLGHQPDLAAIFSQWPDPICWPTVRAQPTLLSPAMLAHMQMRAGISLMLRQYGQGDGERDDEGDAAPLLPTDDPAVDEAASALALAEGRWLMPGGEDQPMRPDLPAEHAAELVWTAAACLAAVARRTAPSADTAMLAAFERSGWALLADHDEMTGPIASADRLVRRMGDAADAPAMLGRALAQRRFLLFVSLAARRLRMSGGQVADILILGPVAQVASLCRALGGSDADYRHLLLALRPVRPLMTDVSIVAEAERYLALTEGDADAAVSAMRAPAAFRAKLDHLSRLAG